MAKSAKKVKKIPLSLEKKLMGGHPVPHDYTQDKNNLNYSKALGFYSYFYTAEESRDFFKEYVKNNKIQIDEKQIDNMSQWPVTVGWIAEMINTGSKMRPETMDYFNKKIEEIKLVKSPDPSERIIESTYSSEIIAQIEKCVVFGDYDKIYLLMRTNDFIKDKEKIKIWFNHRISKNNNQSLNEIFKDIISYEHKQPEIIENSVVIKEKPVVQRKPRKKKLLTPDKILKFIKIKDTEGELKSINKSKILSSDTLILFNTKYRIMTFLVSKKEKFDVYRTAITEIDVNKSFSKKIRKPEEIKNILTGTKKSVEMNIRKLKTTELKVSEKYYTNENVMLLKGM